MNKKTVAQIAYSALFVVLTLVMLVGLSDLLRSKDTTLAGFYSEPDDTVDLIIVGSSHVNNGYVPGLLWQNNSISAYNVYSWTQPMWVSYHYIVEALKTQDIDTVVLEMYGMTYGYSYLEADGIDFINYQNSFDIDPGLNRLQLIGTVAKVGVTPRDPVDFLNIVRYHTRWKSINKRMFTYDPHKDPDPLRGYGLNVQVLPLEDPNIQTDTVFTPDAGAIEYLEKTVALCEKKGIRLIFTLTPYIYNETEAGIFNWIARYAAEHDIPFLNYNGADGTRIGIDWSCDLADTAHLSYTGAAKVTLDLCGYLAEHGPHYEKEQNPHWQELDLDAAKTARVVAANQPMTAQDLTDYLQLTVPDPAYTVLLVNNGTPPAALLPALRAAGFTQDLPDEQHFALALNVQNGSDAGQDLVDTEKIDCTLFEMPGTVRFVYDDGQGNVDIQLNGRSVFANDEGASTFKLVLYDTILQRPLETLTVNEATGALEHREFTGDVLSLFHT